MRVLVAPLDWGLGHATRCIPVIREVLRQGNEVLIAADGNIEQLLKEEFPQQQFIFLKGYNISYSSNLPAWIKIFSQIPKIIFRIFAEHRQLRKIIHKHNIDVVISDNRFGLWNKNVLCIYITHQLMIKCPKGFKFCEPLIRRIHLTIINRYDICWIPDFEGNENLSGNLSHKFPKPINAKFIGPLSRFSSIRTELSFEYDLCIIISGPEPSRTEFEKRIFDQLKSFSGNVNIILGNPKANNQKYSRDGVNFFPHLNSSQLKEIILKSKLVLCRSGYSGIMDLIALGKDAVLVPTPGQTEQEYLAEYLQKKRIFKSARQTDLDLKTLQEGMEKFSVKNFTGRQHSLLQEEIKWITAC